MLELINRTKEKKRQVFAFGAVGRRYGGFAGNYRLAGDSKRTRCLVIAGLACQLFDCLLIQPLFCIERVLSANSRHRWVAFMFPVNRSLGHNRAADQPPCLNCVTLGAGGFGCALTERSYSLTARRTGSAIQPFMIEMFRSSCGSASISNTLG